MENIWVYVCKCGIITQMSGNVEMLQYGKHLTADSQTVNLEQHSVTSESAPKTFWSDRRARKKARISGVEIPGHCCKECPSMRDHSGPHPSAKKQQSKMVVFSSQWRKELALYVWPCLMTQGCCGSKRLPQPKH